MSPVNYFMEIAWLVMMMIMMAVESGARQQSVKLKTSSDGAALCARDPPTSSVRMYQRMPAGTPDVVRCSMACTGSVGCKHFNYVSTESNPCQLYDYRPTRFDVVPGCKHYYQPG